MEPFSHFHVQIVWVKHTFYRRQVDVVIPWLDPAADIQLQEYDEIPCFNNVGFSISIDL